MRDDDRAAIHLTLPRSQRPARWPEAAAAAGEGCVTRAARAAAAAALRGKFVLDISEGDALGPTQYAVRLTAQPRANSSVSVSVAAVMDAAPFALVGARPRI